MPIHKLRNRTHSTSENEAEVCPITLHNLSPNTLLKAGSNSTKELVPSPLISTKHFGKHTDFLKY